MGPWGLLNPLLDENSKEFRFAEPLGQSREVKTALSGLFGRFVARAYATQYLHLTHFTHIASSPMRLSGNMRGTLRRVRGHRGDMPDWAAWGYQKGMAIVEAKGCHEKKGPHQTLRRAFTQANRAEICARNGRLAPFKRYAIATRWGFAKPLDWPPMLWVHDPDETGDDVSPDEIQELQLGIIRLHYANLLDRLEHRKLATALRQIASAPFQKGRKEAVNQANEALDSASARDVTMAFPTQPKDALIGCFVTRGGVLPAAEIAPPDQEILSRLDMRPAFVGIERKMLTLAIQGDIEAISAHAERARRRETHHGPRDDGAGGWVIRPDEDRARIR